MQAPAATLAKPAGAPALTGCSLAISASLMRRPSSLESSCTVSARANKGGAGAGCHGAVVTRCCSSQCGTVFSEMGGSTALEAMATPTSVGGRVLAGRAVPRQAGVEALLVLHWAAQRAEAGVAHVAGQPTREGRVRRGQAASSGLIRVACVCMHAGCPWAVPAHDRSALFCAACNRRHRRQCAAVAAATDCQVRAVRACPVL